MFGWCNSGIHFFCPRRDGNIPLEGGYPRPRCFAAGCIHNPSPPIGEMVGLMVLVVLPVLTSPCATHRGAGLVASLPIKLLLGTSDVELSVPGRSGRDYLGISHWSLGPLCFLRQRNYVSLTGCIHEPRISIPVFPQMRGLIGDLFFQYNRARKSPRHLLSL